jgi:predicted DNA-binding transcriptional regulator AlpA
MPTNIVGDADSGRRISMEVIDPRITAALIRDQLSLGDIGKKIRKMAHEPNPNFTKLLTVDEVAAILRKTPAALRWQMQRGSAPKHGKIGGRVLFRETDVQAYLDEAFASGSDRG